MNSMTGFGKAEVHTRVGDFTVEISSVNSRFLEISARLPRQFSLLEYRLRELAGNYLSRGKVTVFVGYREPRETPGKYRVNEYAIKTYYKQLAAMKKNLKLAGEISVGDLLILPDIAFTEDVTADSEAIWAGIRKAAVRGLEDMIRMRRREGTAMARDMKRRLPVMARHVRRISADSPKVVERYRQKLSARIAELTDSADYDPGRLEQEIAIVAEKSDVSEECTRLLSHIDQYRRGLAVKEPVGKRLNFLLQEMNREVNTIASKCQEMGVLRAAIALKEEVEKLRELVQNVE